METVKALVERKKLFGYIKGEFNKSFDDQNRDVFLNQVKKYVYAPYFDHSENLNE